MAGRKKTTLTDVGETMAFIVERMVTKDDIAALRSELKDDIADIRAAMATSRELADIRREVEHLREQFENVSGFRKEIDHALERIGAIEKHLGLKKKIAA